MNDEQLKAASGEILHIPTVVDAVAVTYNVPELGATALRLSGETISRIFLGNIKRWDDPRIVKDNPGVALPGGEITVVHRFDETGTSFAFTDFLSKASPLWRRKIGAGTSVTWLAGPGSKGIDGMIDHIRQIPNSIGYLELSYALRSNLTIADVKDADGQFVRPSPESIGAAVASVAGDIPRDLRASITYARGSGAYPICALTYFLVYKQQSDHANEKALVDFLWWALHDGQRSAPAMNYGPLPPQIARLPEQQIKSITY